MDVPQIEYDKSKIDCYKLEIQQILGSIGTPDLSLTRDNDAEEPMDVDSVHTPTTSNPESGMNWPCFYSEWMLTPIRSVFPTPQLCCV